MLLNKIFPSFQVQFISCKNVLCKNPNSGLMFFLFTFISGKLLSRTQKIAYNLLHKMGQKEGNGIKIGDRVSGSLNL